MREIKLTRDGKPDKRYKIPKQVKEELGLAMNPEEKPDESAYDKLKNFVKPKEEITTKRDVTLTPEERVIADRVAGGDDWTGITEESIVDFSLANDPYPLPPEAKKLQDEKVYAFRWALAESGRIDELKTREVPLRWWPCNAIRTPELAKYCDTMIGGIRHKDQILMVKPYWMHRKHKDAELSLGENKIKRGELETKDGMKEDWGNYEVGHAISGSDQVATTDESGSFSGFTEAGSDIDI